MGDGFVRVFPFIPSFLLKSLKTSTLLHILAPDSPGYLWYPKRMGSTLTPTAAKSLQQRGVSPECTPEPSGVSCPVCTQLAHGDTVWPACVTAWLCPVLFTWPPNCSPSWFRDPRGACVTMHWGASWGHQQEGQRLVMKWRPRKIYPQKSITKLSKKNWDCLTKVVLQTHIFA